MGLFNRLFGNKPTPQPDAPAERVSESVATMERYLSDIRSHYGEARFQADAQATQILSVYAFGGVTALAIQHQLSPPQAHAVCLAIFRSVFGFEPADAAAKAQAVISAAPDRTSFLYPIIVRGGKGFLHWQQHSDDGAARDFVEIMDHMKKHEK